MRVGIIGGGQLGRMLGESAQLLEIESLFLEPSPSPSAAVAGEVIVAPYDDRVALDRLARECEVVTYELENVPVDTVRYLAGKVAIHPGPGALETAQDRLAEKRFFRSRGVSIAAFVPVDSVEQLEAGIELLGLPAILKTRRMGYDGRGQLYLADPEQASGAFAALGSVPCVLEEVVPFDRELSILAVRDRDGATATWPLVENRHAGGILRWSVAPAPEVDRELQLLADALATRLLEALQYVGVLAVELFQVGDRLLANEIAPRVHNSGHWSIEGALTSQFENHLRAILGLPLGQTSVLLPCGCVNLLGRLPDLSELLAVPGARLHLYGKEPRPGRKLGHVTVLGADHGQIRARIDAVRALTAG
ncbi:MAG TPA: 5-(carboxyamino)imidazole ribonucleotide synthase [Deltaproteobacteria bacterium]|nr:5-(carboxyamino)imidazole ribonucleotide synthase [Deltaproteobacteria bacterium]